ncbi:hypothetical protein DFJ69_5904 [Thermomonospora umbrina]|uniref:Uncharacterized protein n=1 Tax=Thermomonospora umbrina TaxID=111806 RepID=A0A3D9T9D7_9ACTN|nr:hypothetical protein DFJ69_5904 [Thermomonospora umbrina]
MEAIRLDGQEVVRVRCHGILLGYCRTVADVEKILGGYGVELADLKSDREQAV